MKLFLAILMSVITPAWASMYPVAIPYKVEKDTVHSDWIAISFNQKMMDVGPAADERVPKGWMVSLITRNGDYISHTNYSYNGRANGTETFSQMGAKSYHYSSNVTTITQPNSSTLCVTYGGIPDFNAEWSVAITPGGCLSIPPAEEWCKITTPEIVLDHGTITLQQAEGSTATAEFGVNCTSAMKVSFTFVGDENYIYLDEGKAEMSVDNKPMNSPINIPQGNTTLAIKDVLTGVTSEGFHTGSSVMVMQVY